MRLLAALVLVLGTPVAFAANQVRHIQVHVEPYYRAGETREERPRVSVGNQLNERLASNNRADVAQARDLVRAAPATVTPVALMVLAVRLYDVGLRDEAVFWFNVAKDRLDTLTAVLDVQDKDLQRIDRATRTFILRAGPVINGYAFCDPARQQRLRAEALAWVEANPYQTLFLEQMPARPGDRRANLERALATLREDVRAEAAYLGQPANLAKIAAGRVESEADAKYCWASRQP